MLFSKIFVTVYDEEAASRLDPDHSWMIEQVWRLAEAGGHLRSGIVTIAKKEKAWEYSSPSNVVDKLLSIPYLKFFFGFIFTTPQKELNYVTTLHFVGKDQKNKDVSVYFKHHSTDEYITELAVGKTLCAKYATSEATGLVSFAVLPT